MFIQQSQELPCESTGPEWGNPVGPEHDLCTEKEIGENLVPGAL
jgi:hypothetical protein